MEFLTCPITGDNYNPCVYKSCPCIHCSTSKDFDNVNQIYSGSLRLDEINKSIFSHVAKKDDNGKPETIYFYWLGLHAITGKEKYLIMHEIIRLLSQSIDNKNAIICYLSRLLSIYTEENSLVDVSHISKFGAKKYGLLNYRNGFPWSRLVNSLGRHILKEIKGEPDTDTNQPHELHTLANIFMLADHIKNNLGHNDIPELLGGTK